MRRTLVHAVTWALATGGSVTLAWFGVHTVVSGTAYDPPRSIPVDASDGLSGSAHPQVSSTSRPMPSPTSSEPSADGSASPAHRTHSASPDPGSRTPSDAPRSHRPSPSHSSSPSPEGEVKSVSVDGGRAVFDMGSDSASLVSASPDQGWEMRVWKTATWIRVTFAQGDAANSIFCRWDDGPPRIETYAE